MPPVRRPPPSRQAPRPAPRPAPTPSPARQSPRAPAPRPAPQTADRPAPRPAPPQRPAPRPSGGRSGQQGRPPAAHRPAPGSRPGAARPGARPQLGRPGTGAHAARRPAPTTSKGRPAPHVGKGKARLVTKAPVAHAAQSSGWFRVLASVYDAAGGGGSCGNTSDGHFHFAELGVAGNYGHGATSGRGNLAMHLGRPGQLGCGFGLYVRYKGRTTFATKSDVGYGDTSKPPNAQDQRSIDLLRNLANWLHFDGVDHVDVAFHTSGAAPAPPVVGKVQHYFNPLAHAHVTAERIDQGVDYAGTGYLVAIADGIVTENAPGGWAPWGNYLEYRITQPGQLEGAYIFYAEGIDSVVRKGERIRGGARIADMSVPQPHGIEIGFAAGDGTYHSYYYYHDGPYHEGTATRPGLAMSNLIQSLGGPPGRIEGAIVGKWPAYVPDGSLVNITNTLPAQSPAGGQFTTPADAANEASSVDWGASVRRKWHTLQTGAYQGTHHSNAARAFAADKTYLTIGG